MFRLPVTAVVFVAAGLLACTSQSRRSGSAGPSPNISTQPVDSSLQTPLNGRLYRTGASEFDYQATTTITSVDSVSQTDSVFTTAVVKTIILPSTATDSVQVSTQVDSLLVRTVPNTSGPLRMEVAPYQGVLSLKTGQTRLSSMPLDCTSIASERTLRGDEPLPAIPQNIERIQNWADTVRYELCRGGIMLQMQRISTYSVVTSPDIVNQQRLIRNVAIEFQGQGTQWQQSVQALGRGIGIDTLLLSSDWSQLNRISTYSQVAIDFLSARRSQHFVQRMSTELRAR